MGWGVECLFVCVCVCVGGGGGGDVCDTTQIMQSCIMLIFNVIVICVSNRL